MRARIATLFLLLPFAGACEPEEQNTLLNPGEEAQLAPYLTQGAVLELNSAGQFALSGQHLSGDHIQSDRAQELALAYVRSFSRSFAAVWEEQAGTHIDFDALNFIGDPLLAESPFEDLGAEIHTAHRNLYGPQYILVLGVGDQPRLVIMVAAHAQDVGTTAAGWIDFPRSSGNEVYVRGVSEAQQLERFTPERAAVLISEFTNARVASTPTLVTRGNAAGPFDVMWRFEMDRPVSNEGRVAYVPLRAYGPPLRPARWSRDVATMNVLLAAPPPSVQYMPTDLHVRSGHAIDFEEVNQHASSEGS